uniref:Uncharacterized protein n=1 Tax=Grammatophora oceanica TaxID=210454 RepID=A0A7S1VA44_9STRA
MLKFDRIVLSTQTCSSFVVHLPFSWSSMWHPPSFEEGVLFLCVSEHSQLVRVSWLPRRPAPNDARRNYFRRMEGHDSCTRIFITKNGRRPPLVLSLTRYWKFFRFEEGLSPIHIMNLTAAAC